MTWTRVATAAVLIPFVVGLVVWGSTAWGALGLGLVVVLALFEYFSLGDAIGHRAYRFWTATCALLLVYVQWLTAIEPTYQLAGGLTLHREIGRFAAGLLGVPGALFVFWFGRASAAAAAFRAGDYLGGRHGGLFCRPCGGQASVCAASEPEENVGRRCSKLRRIAAGG